jgi:hypothetical protein
MLWFERLLRTLPSSCILDGEITALDETGRPRFRSLMFGHRAPVCVAFDVLVADGQDLWGGRHLASRCRRTPSPCRAAALLQSGRVSRSRLEQWRVQGRHVTRS